MQSKNLDFGKFQVFKLIFEFLVMLRLAEWLKVQGFPSFLPEVFFRKSETQEKKNNFSSFIDEN